MDDADGNSNAGWSSLGKGYKGEPPSQTARQMDETSEPNMKGAKVEETTGKDGTEDPEKLFVPTDELRCFHFKLQYASANIQPSQIRHLLSWPDVPSPAPPLHQRSRLSPVRTTTLKSLYLAAISDKTILQ